MVWKPSYVTTTELKSFLRIDDAVDDIELGFAVSAASRAIDNHTNRQFGKGSISSGVESQERTYTAEWDRRRNRWVVTIDDLMTETLTVTNDDDDAITLFRLEPINADVNGRPWTQLVVDPDSTITPTGFERLVTIDAVWGWTTVPDTVKQAALLQASRFHFRRFSPAGVAGSPETGSELRLLAKVDADVAVALSPFIRWWAAA